MRKLVNEQTEIGLLLAVPGLLATLSLAPWIIRIFYTPEFLPATGLLQWFIIGCLGRVISWPLGFIMRALAKSMWLFLTETIFSVLHLVLIWLGMSWLGLEGIAIAFAALYLCHIAVVYRLAGALVEFSWSAAVRQLLFTFLPIVAIAFFSGRLLSLASATCVGLLLTALVSIICLRGLVHRLGEENRFVQTSFLMPGVRWLCRL